MLTHMPTDRLSVALRVHTIVACFADPSLVDWARTGDERLADLTTGKTAAQIEDMVAQLADEAEQMSLAWNGRDNEIVSGALSTELLLDDYLRMKRGEQWMAFDDDPDQDAQP